MRKVIFAAILFVSFGTQVEAKNKNQKVKAITVTTCLDSWMGNYDGYRAQGYTDSQAISLANIEYRACLNTKSVGISEA